MICAPLEPEHFLIIWNDPAKEQVHRENGFVNTHNHVHRESRKSREQTESAQPVGGLSRRAWLCVGTAVQFIWFRARR